MKVGIFGCGAYGLALSSILDENNCELIMWTKFAEEKENLESYEFERMRSQFANGLFKGL